MVMPSGAIVVTAIAGQRAAVTVSNSQHSLDAMTALGFVKQGDELVRPIKDDDDRVLLVRQLMAAKALFMGGPDWEPVMSSFPTTMNKTKSRDLTRR